jgi:hypothetical protein
MTIGVLATIPVSLKMLHVQIDPENVATPINETGLEPCRFQALFLALAVIDPSPLQARRSSGPSQHVTPLVRTNECKSSGCFSGHPTGSHVYPTTAAASGQHRFLEIGGSSSNSTARMPRTLICLTTIEGWHGYGNA